MSVPSSQRRPGTPIVKHVGFLAHCNEGAHTPWGLWVSEKEGVRKDLEDLDL